jgi:sulfatase maturation enzyme AslB (radical SAM superfamily)
MSEWFDDSSLSRSTFCVLPWVHLSTEVDGVWRRCCFDASGQYDYYGRAEEPDFRLADDAIGCVPNSRYAAANPGRAFGLKQAFNSPNMRRTRLQMLAGERPAACSFCYEAEDAGNDSHRLAMNRESIKHADRAEISALIERTAADGTLDALPYYLDLRLGNTCNLECIMCSFPLTSKMGLRTAPSWTTANINPYNDQELWAELSEVAPTLRCVYFAGGEPFLQSMHLRMLDLLIDRGVAGQVSLRYNSNLTVLPDGIFERFAQFADVLVSASCDGTGAVFERIRVGANWDLFVRNMRTAKQHIDIELEVSPQRDNIANIPELINFAIAENVAIKLDNFVHGPLDMCLRNLPPADKLRHSEVLVRVAEHLRRDGRDDVGRQVDQLRHFICLPPTAPPGADKTAGPEQDGNER